MIATINGNVVFSGEVPTINSPLRIGPVNSSDTGLLFSVTDTQLFPTNLTESYTVSIAVSGGYGAKFGDIYSNYQSQYTYTDPVAVLANSSIDGTTLHIGSINSGNVAIGQFISLSDQANNPDMVLAKITAGSDLTWTVNNNQTILDTTMFTYGINLVKESTATDFVPINTGFINTGPRVSNISVNGVVCPIVTPNTRYGTVGVPSGSTISYNLSLEKLRN
jgi:hypothetical protein